MRILIVNTSENTGGAAVAANRLKEALNNNVMQAASAQMYQGAQGGAQPGADQGSANGAQGGLGRATDRHPFQGHRILTEQDLPDIRRALKSLQVECCRLIADARDH